MSTSKVWLTFEIDKDTHEFLKWFAKIYGKSQKELVNEIIEDFKENTIEYLKEIAKEDLEEKGIMVEGEV